jgi:hypothetical protein
MYEDKNDSDSLTLADWIVAHPSEEDLRSIFLNMDRALKYIHDHNYCIQVFYPTEIQVLNNEDDYIQFNKLMELPEDGIMRERMIAEDIFNSSFIQIGVYSKSLKYLKPEFLRENFDSFAEFLPAEDVPYYRGVIERGATVYFCEYALEKRNRELVNLDQQLGENGAINKVLEKQKVDLTNESINDVIYKQINGYKDRAFVNYLLVPTIVLGMLVLFGVLSWVATWLSS